MNLDLVKPALTGVFGTAGMTMFSEVTTQKKNHQFREHEILSELLKVAHLKKNNRLALGWAGHFMTGMVFNIINQRILKAITLKPSILNGLLFGAANGLVGIAIWKVIFELHPSPPKINLPRYLGHLMLAHLVFAVLSNISMNGMAEESLKTSNI